MWRDALGNEGFGGNYADIKKSIETAGFAADYVFQDYLKGDGYAILSAKDNFMNFDGDILIVWGNMAVLNPDTVLWLIMMHHALEDVPLSIATAAKEKPYAPIMSNADGQVAGSKKGEMNFVQIASILAQEGREVIAPPIADIREFQGVNTPDELKQAERFRTEMMMEKAFVIPAADLIKRQRQIAASIKIAA